MNIDRHNYEEYFILYMDNELNSAERRMVETFVQNNPDLKDELDILLQSKLTPDTNIVFDGKEELMKTADDSAINLNNYEEWLTLYIDNELSSDQKRQVETFVASHPQIQNEFAILQKTKLQAEEIAFPYKESLYRRTEKVRVIQMRWWRVAAAAILLLALSTTVILILNKKKQPQTGIANNPTNNKEVKTETKNNIATNSEIKTPQPENNETKKTNQSDESKLAIHQDQIGKKLQENKNDKPSNNLPQPLNNSYLKTDPIKTEIAINAPNNENTISPTNKVPVTKDPSNPFIPSTTSGKITDNPDATYAKLEEGGQNKNSRGFFRKAVRFIEKRTGIKPANDDDKVLIGSLAVKL